MSEQLQAGPELDRFCCEAMTAAGLPGWEPTVLDQWYCPGCCQWSKKATCCGSTPDNRIVIIYPRVSTDWAVAGRALEAMQELGYSYHISGFTDHADVYLNNAPLHVSGTGDVGPEAIARAIPAALEARG